MLRLRRFACATLNNDCLLDVREFCSTLIISAAVEGESIEHFDGEIRRKELTTRCVIFGINTTNFKNKFNLISICLS
jgi:hypothetical protein